MATAEGGPTIHPEAPGNVGYDWSFGDEAEVAGIFARAAHATRLELIDNRVMAMPMEVRGCFAEWDGTRLHVGFSGQGVWGLKDELDREARTAGGGGAGDDARRRRRLRHQGLHLSRVLRSSPSPPASSAGRCSG